MFELIKKFVSFVFIGLIFFLIFGSTVSVGGAESTTVTLTAVADATVKSWQPDSNFGSESVLDLSYSTIDEACEAVTLLRFDLSSALPKGAIIDSANLELFLVDGAGADPVAVAAYFVTSDWTESSVTWNSFPTVEPIEIISKVDVDANPGSYKSFWGISGFAQAWYDGSNYGIFLRGPVDGTYYQRTFASREHKESVPQLVVTYHLSEELPDLVITEVWNDDEGRICYSIANIGEAVAPGGHCTAFFIDGVNQMEDCVREEIEPGAGMERCFEYDREFTTSEDIMVCADHKGNVEESNEENNCMKWSSGASLECVDFEDPLLGTTFNVGDIFTDSGATITVQSFQWGNGIWTTDGHAEVGNAGDAGGSGQEIWVNNVNLDFDFGSPCSGISLLFGEYGGNLNIEINGDFRNFEDFVDINGLNIGGVNVLVVNGFGNDKGSLELSGTINSFVIGGQELCIDDVCPTALEEEVPDLIVTLNGPEKVIAGEDVALEVIVSNIGSATAPGSIESEIVYYVVDLILSSDNFIPLELAVHPVYAGKTREDFVEDMLLEGGRISRTESISPGNSVNYTFDLIYTLHIPENTSPGIYCLGAVVDPAEAVEELSEENNIYCHKINILPPETPPVLPPEKVDFWVMPYAVGGTTLNNINANGLTSYTDWKSGHTMVDAPFGSRLGLRHGYDNRIPTSDIMYYRWSYKHESETKWQEFTEPVNVHYVKDDHGIVTSPVYSLGPKGINGMNLYEFRPHNAPDVCESTEDCKTYWPTTDWFADIYSGFLESNAISNGKYDIKLEIYDKTGNQVIPDGIKFDFIVPTGVDGDGTILTREATPGEIDNGGFVFPLHIDNSKCSATIDAPSIGTIAMTDECGFLRYSPGDKTVHIAFHATHPNNFALFNFRIFRGSTPITSVKGGEVGAYLVGNYDGDGYGNFENETSMGLLLGSCNEAAFSENLHIYAKATTGWGHRINRYDAHAVRAFALSPK